MSIKSTLEALCESKIECVVVGGVAATLQGSVRATFDVDICYSTKAENIERLVKLLNNLRAELRGAERGLPFVIDMRTFRDCPLLTLTTTEGDLDLMDTVAGVGDYAKTLEASQETQWNGLKFRSLTLSALIAAKRATARKKDQEHLLELEALRELRRKE